MSDLMHPTRQCQSASESAREPRCPTAAAKETWQKSRGDSMSLVMGNKVGAGQCDNLSTPKKRVKDEYGNEIEPQRSAGINQVMHAKQEDYSFDRAEPRVRLDVISVFAPLCRHRLSLIRAGTSPRRTAALSSTISTAPARSRPTQCGSRRLVRCGKAAFSRNSCSPRNVQWNIR